MDYSLPIAKRTRAKEEEMFREIHKAYKKIKIQKQHGSSNAESMSIDALSGKKSSRNGEGSGNLGPDLSTVVLDDSDEDVVFIGVVEETKEEEYVSIADDDDDVGLDGSQVGENIGFSFRGVKMEDGVEESEGRKVEGSSTCRAPGIGGSGLGTRIIEDERGASDEVLTMSEDDEETEKPTESEHDDEDEDYCPSSSDEESRSSSGEESAEEVEEVKEGDDDKDEKEILVRKMKKNSKMGDEGKRSSKKEIVEEWSGGKEDGDERAVLLEKRKKKNKKENEGKRSSKKEIDDGNGRSKFGTANHPICLDEVESDASGGGGGIDDDDEEEEEEEDQSEEEEEKEEDQAEEVEKKNEDQLYRGKPIMRKRTRAFKEDEVVKILADSIWHNTELNFEEENGPVNEQTALPLKFTFGVEEQSPPRRTEEDKELDEIWADLAVYINDASDDAVVRNDADIAEIELGKTNDTAARCSKGCHDLVLDDEKGLVCKFCFHVELETKYCVEPFARNPYGRSSKRDSDMVDRSIFGQLHQDSIYHSRIGCNAGTVWDIIPGIGEGMHDHQREGFEFLWKNIAGGIDLEKLDNPNSFNGGNGCIISHAPGTGKTRLAIAFIQSYMELYPACRPVIVAPCGMLNAWEDEFRKWNYVEVEVPFHNLNKFELSGNEDKDAIALLERCKSSTYSSDSTRLVKFYSWRKDRSILAISYQLFIEFAGEASRKRKGRFSSEGGEHVRKSLLEFPGLLVLDEGHIPRNDTSLLWKTFEKVKTGKRIILSGTPFQNNFDELFNTLSLAYPKFLDSVSSSQHRALPKRRRKGSEAKQLWDSLTSKIDETGDDSGKAQKLAAVREVIGPFVHVHKGDILQRKLPGLRDSVVILHPPSVQKTVIDAVQQKKINNFKFEFFTSVVSVHPSLLPKSFPVEGTSIDCSMLECMRLNPDAGSKTKFVMELIRLSMVRNEKVLVFSQYIRSLKLVSDQLKSLFEWIPEKDFLYMDGKLELDRRKASIDNFNIDSEAKVMLASTKACCEGINLVGASRVVLLDVVWNPSVERQAISRAYRLGQKKIVHVYHLISSGSKEEEKYWRQAKKDKLSEIVFHSAADDQSGSRSNPDQVSSDIGSNDRIMEDMVRRLDSLFKKIIYQPKESNLVQSFGLMDM